MNLLISFGLGSIIRVRGLPHLPTMDCEKILEVFPVKIFLAKKNIKIDVSNLKHVIMERYIMTKHALYKFNNYFFPSK